MRRMTWGGRYSIVASTLALLLSVGGTAYAVNTVRSADIVNGTIQSVDVKNGTLGTVDSSPASLGSSPRLFAHVKADATLGASRGVTDYEFDGAAHLITFNRNLTACAVVATPWSPSGSAVYAHTFRQPETGGRQIIVFTEDAGGSPSPSPVDVIAVC